jgi:hypothetical protein
MTARPHGTCRAVAIAIPVKNEAGHLRACLDAIDVAAGRFGGRVTIVAMANDCDDGSLSILRAWRPRHATLDWRAVCLLPGARHAGWARRLALDAAGDALCSPRDLLLSTDADTYVAPDWITRIVAHVDLGNDAVAGRAFTLRDERAALGPVGRHRLNQLGRYYTALDYVAATMKATAHDPWPRHFYEGGASIALTLGLYRRIGGAPTPPVAEDRALFDRIRSVGGRIRHPLDVRVFTSCRIEGRAPGGMADAVARWILQPADTPLHEVYAMPAALSPASATPGDQISFVALPRAIAAAQAMIRRLRKPPQVEPVRFVPVAACDGHPVAQRGVEFGDRIVPGLGVVGQADPVDQQYMTA